MGGSPVRIMGECPPLCLCCTKGHPQSGSGPVQGGRKWPPTPVFLPGESRGRQSLVGCRLWGRTESARLKEEVCLVFQCMWPWSHLHQLVNFSLPLIVDPEACPLPSLLFTLLLTSLWKASVSQGHWHVSVTSVSEVAIIGTFILWALSLGTLSQKYFKVKFTPPFLSCTWFWYYLGKFLQPLCYPHTICTTKCTATFGTWIYSFIYSLSNETNQHDLPIS